MKTNLTKPSRTPLVTGLLTLLLLVPAVALRPVAKAAELRGVLDGRYLNLSWEAPGGKLQEATTPTGPWQTVTTAVCPYRAATTSAGKFYRLILPAPGKKWLTVAAVTMTAQTNTAANLQTFFSYMQQAAGNGVDLIVFPEVALQGCPGWRENNVSPSPEEMAYTRQTAETVPGPSTSNLVVKVNELNLFVVFGMTETDTAGKLYNAAVFLGPSGVVGTHRKSVQVGNDSRIWTRGTNAIEVFESPLGGVGPMICAELYSGGDLPGPRLAAQGADLLVSTSAWWTSVGEFWDATTTANARQANRWHVAANAVGRIGYAWTYGHSRVIDPLGQIVCDTGATEGLVIWPTDIVIDANR